MCLFLHYELICFLAYYNYIRRVFRRVLVFTAPNPITKPVTKPDTIAVGDSQKSKHPIKIETNLIPSYTSDFN